MLACVVACLFWFYNAAAQEKGKGRFRVVRLLFGYLYPVANKHTAEGDGATGFLIRSGYFTFDAKFSERWCGGLRFDLKQSGRFETCTFEVRFKDLNTWQR